MPKVIGGSIKSHREHVTAQIFDAVGKILYERGYDGLSLAEVAEACGMARTAMYNYFPDKAALFVAFITHETDRYLERLEAALEPIENPVEQLRTYIRFQLEYFAGNHLPPGPAVSLVLPEGTNEGVQAHVAVLEETLSGIVTRGHDERLMVVDDVAATVAMISACISRVGDDSKDVPVDETVRATETFVLRAVGVSLDADGQAKRVRRR